MRSRRNFSDWIRPSALLPGASRLLRGFAISSPMASAMLSQIPLPGVLPHGRISEFDLRVGVHGQQAEVRRVSKVNHHRRNRAHQIRDRGLVLALPKGAHNRRPFHGRSCILEVVPVQNADGFRIASAREVLQRKVRCIFLGLGTSHFAFARVLTQSRTGVL